MGTNDDYFLWAGLARPLCFQVEARFPENVVTVAVYPVASLRKGSFHVRHGGAKLVLLEDIPLSNLAGELLHMPTQFIAQRPLLSGKRRQRPAVTPRRHSDHFPPGAKHESSEDNKQDSQSFQGRA